jgi:hypothetical protein
MRLLVVLLCVGLLTSCALRKRNRPPAANPPPGAAMAPPVAPVVNTATPPPNSPSKLIVTPGHLTTGRVSSVNAAGRFVILTFPLGAVPSAEKRLYVYRGGLKVGEVKVTPPPLDINIAADIIAGECQIGDEVRDE